MPALRRHLVDGTGGCRAIRVVFDELRDTGIYSWDHLQTLDREQVQRWKAYLKRLGRRVPAAVRKRDARGFKSVKEADA